MSFIYEKLMKVKMKWFGTYAQFTVAQIAILRLIPFFHYHLLMHAYGVETSFPRLCEKFHFD